MATASARRRLPEPRSTFRIVLLWFFLSGATALVYEVVWLRMLSLVFVHAVYAITTVLAAFMAGLGLESFLFGRRAARFPDPIRAYGLLEIGIGASCALTPVLVWLASSVYLRPMVSRANGEPSAERKLPGATSRSGTGRSRQPACPSCVRMKA